MTLVAYQDMQTFKGAVIPYLEKEQEKNNLPLGILNNPAIPSLQAMGIYFKQDLPAAVFLQTANHHQMAAAFLQPLNDTDSLIICKSLSRNFNSIGGFVGEKEAVYKLGEKWEELHNIPIKKVRNQRIYKLSEVKNPEALASFPSAPLS